MVVYDRDYYSDDGSELKITELHIIEALADDGLLEASPSRQTGTKLNSSLTQSSNRQINDLLMQLSNSDDANLRLAVLARIAQIEQQQILYELESHLFSPLQELSKTELELELDERFLNTFLTELALYDEDYSIRSHALELLAELDQGVKSNAAVDVVKEIKNNALLTVIDSVMDDPDPRVRGVALETLEDLDDSDLPLDRLSQIAMTDEEPDLRMQALALFVDTDPARANDLLAWAIMDSNPDVSALALALQANLD